MLFRAILLKRKCPELETGADILIGFRSFVIRIQIADPCFIAVIPIAAG
jgi:hypothetical protein